MLVRIAHDPGHAGQRRQFLWCALRVATGHQYAAIRIDPLQPPYGRTSILVRARGDRAGVEHNNFGLARRRGSLQPALQKLPLQGCPIGLRSPAAKILYVEAIHAPILNEWMLRLTRVLKNSSLVSGIVISDVVSPPNSEPRLGRASEFCFFSISQLLPQHSASPPAEEVPHETSHSSC